jgi:hypothetical protein
MTLPVVPRPQMTLQIIPGPQMTQITQINGRVTRIKGRAE